MDVANPRYSTNDILLRIARAEAAQLLLDREHLPLTMERGGPKAHRLVLEEIGEDAGPAQP